jgi:hypothetical protein
MCRTKSPRKLVRKCGKAIGQAGSRIRRCGKKAAAKVHAIERRRWVPICAEHALEFRKTFPDWWEYLKCTAAQLRGDVMANVDHDYFG